MSVLSIAQRKMFNHRKTMAGKKAIESVGRVTETLGSDRFRVELDNGVEIIAYPSGRVRLNHIRILTGDRVRVELSPYDMMKGRISRRL